MRRLVLAGVVLVPVPLAAQRWLTVDASAGALEHQFARASHAVSLAPRLTWLERFAHLDGGFVYSRGTELRWNAEASLKAGVSTPLGGHWAIGVNADGGWSAHHQRDGTAEISLLPSLRFDTRAAALGLTLGAGRASTASGTQFYGRAALDAVGYLGSVGLRGRIARTRFTEDALRATVIWIPNGPLSDTALRRYVNSYNDLELSASWSNSRLRVEGGLLRRIGLEEFRATGWHVEATARITSQLTLFGVSGRSLSRLTVDLPARGYTTLGLRWLVFAPRVGSPTLPVARSSGGFRVERGGPTVRFMMPAPHAAAVELMGDFTDWEPVAMRPDSQGWWMLSRTLAPGIYRINVRVDGGPWRVPPGIPTEDDDLGGKAGVLLVP